MNGDLCASVIIPCHRADAELPLQLEALSRQVDAPPFEVLLVDNGDNRDLRRIAADATAVLPNLRVVDATDRRGAGYARNVGIGAARTDRLLFCDADDVAMPEWVNLGVRQLERTPVFSGGAVPVTEQLCAKGWEAVVDHVGPHEEPTTALPLSGSVDYPILMGGSFGIHRNLAVELGGFDLSFGSVAEDNDLAFRIVRAGHDVVDAGHVCIAYRIRDETGGFRRGVRAGIAHGRLCAVHGAWGDSPAYRGRWLGRLFKAVVAIPWRWMRTARNARPVYLDALGRQIGCAIGWLRYRGGIALGASSLSVGIEEGTAWKKK